MIEKQHIPTLLIKACPSFKAVLDTCDDQELHYMVAGDFAHHLLQLYSAQKLEEFPDVAKLIEELHINGDEYVKEYATIGILEGIQNVWGNNGSDPEKFAAFLLPVSLKYWQSLNRFWNGEIPVVGIDVEKN